MKFIVTDLDGNILRSGVCQDIALLNQAGENELAWSADFPANYIDDETHRIDIVRNKLVKDDVDVSDVEKAT